VNPAIAVGFFQGVLINVVLCSVESGLGTGGVGGSEVTWGSPRRTLDRTLAVVWPTITISGWG